MVKFCDDKLKKGQWVLASFGLVRPYDFRVELNVLQAKVSEIKMHNPRVTSG